MPSIPFYATDADLRSVLDYLNDDPEVEFIVANGPKNWRTVERLPHVPASHQMIWHKPGGPLPPAQRSAIPGRPFYGSVPMVVTWDVAREGPNPHAPVPMSALGWIGDRYKATGQGAAEETTRWWRALQKWVADQTREFTRGGKTGDPRGGTIAAFPEAATRLDAGAAGEMNPPSA